MIDKEKFEKLGEAIERPDKYGFNLTVSIFKVKDNHLCDMCGENKATCVILDPNKYPDNDWNKRSDFWDVCSECRDFIHWGMGKTFETYMENIAMRDGKTKGNVVSHESG